MKEKSIRNVNKICAIATFIFIMLSMVTIAIPAHAITENGFCYWNEVSPPNQNLFTNATNTLTTGIVQNNNNYEIYCCCAQTINNNNNYYGMCIFSVGNSYDGIRYKNVNGTHNLTEADFKPVVSNNEIVGYAGCNYFYDSGTMSAQRIFNNYSYAEFVYHEADNQYTNGYYTPNNSIASQFIEYVVEQSGGGSSQNPSSINYPLPAGNIAIIETDSSYSYVNLTTTMPLQSTSFASNPWPNTTQRIGYYSTLPQTLNPNTMGNVIEWERNGNTTLFNVTTSAKYNPNIVSTFKYVVIANPYYYPANDMEDSQYTNGEINISMDGVVNITVKSLTATVNTQTGVVEDNYNGTEWTGVVDETTNDIIWTDGNGENNAPTSGGNLNDPSITGFQSWLKGILNNIVNIFEPAHDAISTLSGAVSNFASWMYALYVWLPSPILSLLTSAISLAIVIGIIKVFI